MRNLVLLSVVVVALFLGEAIYWLARYSGEHRRQELRRRLRMVGEADARSSLLRPGRYARSAQLDGLLRGLPGLSRLERLLAQTDLSWTVATLLSISFGLGGLGIALGLLLDELAIGTALGVLLAGVPALMLRASRERRSAKISRQLPEALDLMGRSLRAGHALPTSLKLAAQELPTPVATELGRVYEDHMLGAPIGSALHHMTERVPDNLDLRIVATSVAVAQQVGGNLVEIFENIAATIRERFKFYGQLQALTAEGRMSGRMLAALPWAVLVALYVLRREYVTDYLSDPTGQMLALCGLGLWLVGVVWMRRTVKVDV